MSIDTPVPASELPPKTRILDLRVFNAVTNADGSLIKPASVTFKLVRCWPALDEAGNPVLNPYGFQAYRDTVLECEYAVADFAKLMPYVGTLWGPLMDAAEAFVADAIEAGDLVLPMPQLAL